MGPTDQAARQMAAFIMVLQIYRNLDSCVITERGVSGVTPASWSDNMRAVTTWTGQAMRWPLRPWDIASSLTPFFCLLNIREIKVAR